MNHFTLACDGYGPLHFVGARPHEGHDRLLTSNAHGQPVDLLCLLDSRGISAQYQTSLAQRVITHAEQQGLHYVMICRPLELTTWATVANFFTHNPLRAPTFVTNMGFVDFTPKKPEILEDAMRQVEAHIGAHVATASFVEKSVRANGDVLSLFAMQYSEDYGRAISRALQGQRTVVINSPLVSPTCEFPRPRPASFFKALEDGNTFNRGLPGVTVVDLPEFDLSLTYDGVHYTEQGSAVIFDRLKEYL